MPEQQNIEYKSSWHDDYLKWICGFANVQSGRIKPQRGRKTFWQPQPHTDCNYNFGKEKRKITFKTLILK